VIVSIRGILIEKSPNAIVVDVSGIGYECLISVNTYDMLPTLNQEVNLLTYFHVTENGQWLYGFSDESEKSMFTLLISVSGIGPRTAINMLSAVNPEEFKRRLIASEVKMLTALPGIGPKTARRIIVELKDKFVKLDEEELPIEGDEILSPAMKEANDALLTLGFKQNDITVALNEIRANKEDLSAELILKSALAGLS